MAGLWPTGDELPGFKAVMLAFERANWALGMKVLSCFALKLGFRPDFFTDCHDPLSSEYQSTLRLIHYLPMVNAKPADFTGRRAGAHTDFDCLTLLHQRSGQGGLQLCPGKDAPDIAWTDVAPLPGVVTCNIGDMLMRWSDDKLLSTLHRIRMPRADEYFGPRYSIPFFCQANKDAVIRAPPGVTRRSPRTTICNSGSQRITQSNPATAIAQGTSQPQTPAVAPQIAADNASSLAHWREVRRRCDGISSRCASPPTEDCRGSAPDMSKPKTVLCRNSRTSPNCNSSRQPGWWLRFH
jgi:isopenicillin N synthase-like dioxygenase